jgi:hypothetical protein
MATRTRDRVKALASRKATLGPQAGWIARQAIERWAPHQLPQPIVLVRRPTASDEQWAYVNAQLDIGIAELVEHDVPVCIAEWTPVRGVVSVGDQLALV